MGDAAAALPGTGRVAVFDTPNGPFRLADSPLRPPARNEAMVRVRMSTIFRSDVHSCLGHRPSPCPGLLGHEIIGTIVAIGQYLSRDRFPFGDLVDGAYPLLEVGRAMADAASHRVLRAAIVP